MIADRNKTNTTLALTEAACGWLARIGCKPIECEVPVRRGWVADIAALWRPTVTELKRAKLVPRSSWREAREARAKLPAVLTVVLEVKADRGDYLREFRGAGKSRRAGKFSLDSRMPAHMCVAAVASKVLQTTPKRPAGWALLEISDSGVIRRVTGAEAVMPTAPDQALRLACEIGERRHNRTEQAWLRDLRKRHREEQARDRIGSIWANVIGKVLELARGDATLEDVERAYCTQARSAEMPRWLRMTLDEVATHIVVWNHERKDDCDGHRKKSAVDAERSGADAG